MRGAHSVIIVMPDWTVIRLSSYARYGFQPLIKNSTALGNTTPMFLPMKVIEKFLFPQP